MGSTHDGTFIFEKEEYKPINPTKAESLVLSLYLRSCKLNNQIVLVANNERYNDAYELLKESFDNLSAIMSDLETLKP